MGGLSVDEIREKMRVKFTGVVAISNLRADVS